WARSNSNTRCASGKGATGSRAAAADGPPRSSVSQQLIMTVYYARACGTGAWPLRDWHMTNTRDGGCDESRADVSGLGYDAHSADVDSLHSRPSFGLGLDGHCGLSGQSETPVAAGAP